MVRTQIQLPNDIYAKAKQIAEQREISLAELTRRGLEYMLGVYAAAPVKDQEWQPPVPQKLGWRGLSPDRLKQEAQISRSE